MPPRLHVACNIAPMCTWTPSRLVACAYAQRGFHSNHLHTLSACVHRSRLSLIDVCQCEKPWNDFVSTIVLQSPVTELEIRRAGPFIHLGWSWHRVVSLTYRERTLGWFVQALSAEHQEAYRMLSKIIRGTSRLFRWGSRAIEASYNQARGRLKPQRWAQRNSNRIGERMA